jgi:hypothetical protein
MFNNIHDFLTLSLQCAIITSFTDDTASLTETWLTSGFVFVDVSLVVSQLIEAYARREHNSPNSTLLAVPG